MLMPKYSPNYSSWSKQDDYIDAYAGTLKKSLHLDTKLSLATMKTV